MDGESDTAHESETAALLGSWLSIALCFMDETPLFCVHNPDPYGKTASANFIKEAHQARF